MGQGPGVQAWRGGAYGPRGGAPRRLLLAQRHPGRRRPRARARARYLLFSVLLYYGCTRILLY
eukprot:COSAG01_NODE_6433_length_3669_cov_61.729412_4_plen_63_part_00